MLYNEIGGGNLDQILQQRLNVKGPGAVAPTVAPEVMPVLALEVDRPEWSVIKGEVPVSIRVTQNAVVGNFSFAWISLAAGSGLLFVCTRIKVNAASTGVSLRFGNPQGVVTVAGSQAMRARDSRVSSLAPIIVQLGDSTTVAGAGNVIDTFVPGDDIEVPIILAQGQGMTLTTGAVNNNLDVRIYGYYRNLVTGELG